MSRLVSDEELADIWSDGGSFNEAAGRIESLVRKRLAERLRVEALKWEGSGQGDGLLGAANIVEGEE